MRVIVPGTPFLRRMLGRAAGSVLFGCVAVTAMVPGGASAFDMPAKDIPRAKDHPIISRFAGSKIIGYAHADFDERVFPVARAIDDDRFEKTERHEGEVTRLAYVAPEDKSPLEIMRNIEQALQKAGFKTVYQCTGNEKGCGTDFYYVSTHLRDADPKLAGEREMMIGVLSPKDGDGRMLVAHLDRPQGAVDVLIIAARDGGKPVGVLYDIVEAKPVSTGQVTVQADAMRKGLQEQGHIALYGLTFATDSATLNESSNATVVEMAKVLKADPKQQVFIVGHTDNVGTTQHNLQLSQQRADSVVRALVAQGIAASRLVSKGVASFAPVASNADETGRAKNRRVEMVAQ